MESSATGRGGKILITAGMLDEDGKAYYGTPGPGTYRTATDFRQVPAKGAGFNVGDDPGCQVYQRSGAFSIAARHSVPEKLFISPSHNATYYGQESPGPAYVYEEVTKPSAPRAAFGLATRNEENKARFISRDHCSDAAGVDSPGPALYKLPHGKGIARTVGDAPTWAFGTASQRTPSVSHQVKDFPGPGSHTMPKTIGGTDSLHYSFGVMDDFELGMMRARDDNAGTFVSELHSSTDNHVAKSNPGPGAYDSPHPDVHRNHQPSWTFPMNPRQTERPVKLFISKDHISPEESSPGPAYRYEMDPVTRRKPTPAFATSNRMLNPELGGNKGGSIISRAHAQAYAGAESPGPGTYDSKTGKGHYKTLGDCPLSVFGTEKRNSLGKMLEAARGVPGPGAYMPKNNGGAAVLTMAPRTDFSKGADPDEPGPGTYEPNNGLAVDHPTKRIFGKTKFGKSRDRSTFVTSQPGYTSPGPAAYTARNKYDDIIDSAPKYSFGAPGRDQSDTKTPGPGQYDHRTGKGHQKTMGDAPNMKFGSGARVNPRVFISDSHNRSVGDAYGEMPGPGHYDISKVRSATKFKNRGGFSFGTAKRQFGATVKF